MQLQSSYIFLPNPYSKNPSQREDENGVLYIETGHSVHDYIEKTFPNMVSKVIDGIFLQYEYSVSLETDGKPVGITIISKKVVDSYYVNVVVVGKARVQLIEVLEYVHSALFSAGIAEDYIPIVSYDAISEYYCNKLYPKLNRLERNLRKLLFNIYVLNFGKDYFQTTTTKEMQDKAKKIIQARGRVKKKETQYVKQYFYSLEYADIQQLLFAPRWTKIDEENKKAFLNTHKDLSTFSDEELRAVINNISPKSDWERFFEEKFQDVDIEGDIEAVRIIRNNVAHCKFLTKEQYISCSKTISTLNKALNKAIRITEEKDFADKNTEYWKEVMSDISSRIHELVAKFREAVSPSMQGFRDIIKATSLCYGENLQGAIEAISTLKEALRENTKLLYFGDSFKNDLNDTAQPPSD